jgi:hypothetical protein
MWSVGGFMGLGWVLTPIGVGVAIWLLVRGPLAGATRNEGRSALDIL